MFSIGLPRIRNFKHYSNYFFRRRAPFEDGVDLEVHEAEIAEEDAMIASLWTTVEDLTKELKKYRKINLNSSEAHNWGMRGNHAHILRLSGD